MACVIAREKSLHYIPKLLPIPKGRKSARVFFANMKERRARCDAEIETARLMTRFGYDVQFIEMSRQVNSKMADCVWNGKEWGLKIIKRNDCRAVVKTFIAAIKRCDRVILDVGRTQRGALRTARDIIDEVKKRKGRMDFTEIWILDKDYYCVVRKNMLE